MPMLIVIDTPLYLRLNPQLDKSVKMDTKNPEDLIFLRETATNFLAEEATKERLGELRSVLCRITAAVPSASTRPHYEPEPV